MKSLSLPRLGRLLPATPGQRVALLLLVGIVGYGAMLRLDALTQQYGPVQEPAWLRATQQWRVGDSRLRPQQMTWEPVTGRYISDPYTYLQYARAMTSFYAAHRREPLFPFATKVSLALLRDQDVAVSFASATFSVFAIVATFLLGARAFSRFVGLAAAAALAIEYDVISWGTRGWRDDMFTCAVVLVTYACVRLWQAPSRGNAVLMGIVGAAACLVRITSLSFLVPAMLLFAVGRAAPAPVRLRRVGLATLLVAVLAGPYVINCWRVYGDPLYAINVHSDIYRTTEGTTVETSETAVQYLGSMVRARPLRTLDTFVLGLTSYPFANKWHGFDVWHPWIARVLAPAAVIGLLLMAGSAAGRIVLLVGLASLVPYSLTWRLIADWRFTEHVYPLLLIAAMVAIERPAILAHRAWRMRGAFVPPARSAVVWWTCGLSALALATAVVVRWLPVWTAHEALAAGEDVTIAAGGRDSGFFRGDWSAPIPDGNVTARVARGPDTRVILPLAGIQDYGATIRLDPYPRPSATEAGPLPTVQLALNGRLIATIPLQWNPDRVGAYDFVLPASALSTGANTLAIVALRPPAGGPAPAFRLWYVRVRPPGGT